MTDLFATIERRSIWQDVANQIRTMIETKGLPPGEKLPSERTMCQQFGISRISLREALRALEREGYIEVHAGRGAFVRSRADRERHMLETWVGGNGDNVAKVFELRMLFEPNLAALAAKAIDRDHVEKLRASVEELAANIDDPEKAIKADADFHRILGESTGNSLIDSLVHFVMTATGSERQVTLATKDGLKQALEGHTRILDCVAKGDEAGAAAAMKAHLEDAMDYAARK